MTMMMTRMMMTHITHPKITMMTARLTPSSGPPEESSGKPTRRVTHKKKGQVKLSGCTYVDTLISVHTFWFYDKISMKCILYPRTLCLIIYS